MADDSPVPCGRDDMVVEVQRMKPLCLECDMFANACRWHGDVENRWGAE